MRHESIATTMRYYVGRNAQSTAEVLWAAHERLQVPADGSELEPSVENVAVRKGFYKRPDRRWHVADFPASGHPRPLANVLANTNQNRTESISPDNFVTVDGTTC